MKIKKITKKLTLNKEVIAILTEDNQQTVIAGAKTGHTCGGLGNCPISALC